MSTDADIALTRGLPAPTDLPELPAAAGDRTWDLAARLTGAAEMRGSAADMIAAGADREDVTRALRAVDRLTQTLAELLDTVQTITDAEAGGSTLGRRMQAVREVIA